MPVCWHGLFCLSDKIVLVRGQCLEFVLMGNDIMLMIRKEVKGLTVMIGQAGCYNEAPVIIDSTQRGIRL